MLLDLLRKFSHFSIYGITGISVYVTFNDCICTFASVNGASMEPTLNPKDKKRNDVVFLNRWRLDYDDIKPGDVVVLADPKHSDSILIKRIIGIEGDTIRTPRYKYDYASIPRGHCWVEGDNKLRSMDSNSFGSVALGLIDAKATHIVWPPSRWSKLSTAIPNSRYPITWSEYIREKRKKRELEEKEKEEKRMDLMSEIDIFLDDLIDYDEVVGIDVSL